MSGYFELDSKRALVTGGTKGVGAAVAAAIISIKYLIKLNYF